jgi:predicted Fe-S protein YdhL (DUF1289 family)
LDKNSHPEPGMTQEKTPTIATSPCINVCRLDASSRYCQGCFRTIDEISFWSRASNDEKLAILAAAVRRRDDHLP